MKKNIHLFDAKQIKHFRRVYSWMPQVDSGCEFYLIGGGRESSEDVYSQQDITYISLFSFIKKLFSCEQNYIVHGNLFSIFLFNSMLYFMSLGLIQRCSWVCWGAGLNIKGTYFKRLLGTLIRYILYRPLSGVNFLMAPDEELFLGIVPNAYTQVTPYLTEPTDVEKFDNGFLNIFIGNQSSAHHNHLHFIEEISQINTHKNIKVHLFMNYGNGDDIYKDKVKDMCSSLLPNRYVIYSEMMPYSEYLKVISLCDVCIVDTKHQTGLGLIYNSIKVGARIFLNVQGSNNKWLNTIGIKTYDCRDLSRLIELKDNTEKINMLIFNDYFDESNLKDKWKNFTSNLNKNRND
ncbi:TDP-N-acetylfucosamine:lipid II N-acetylfucosaminyltransferase [Pseudoalteromonas porphyrae]|uniref:4-alpha-L-fucosyltransferase n=1 Tax=Pseudoalteromonas porphyrae TaxID=187330 RepID=A0A0N1EPN1_9GAMM|nr:TDP-N-acetylfucosamine:lipid II N-acetylfucosaminyltransferase [Pseudoalteromonas porphyrae]KPH65142.1 hypothetical protein ADS77_02400 [Pseudoalteromonas porphyrae]